MKAAKLSTIMTTTTLSPTQRSVYRLELQDRRLLLRAGDLFLTLLAVSISLFAWSAAANLKIDLDLVIQQLRWMAGIVVFWSVWLHVTSAYDMRPALMLSSKLQSILLGGVLLALLYVSYFFVRAIPLISFGESQSAPPLRLAPGLGIVLTTGFISIWHLISSYVWVQPNLRRRILILGAGAAGVEVASLLKMHKHVVPVGFVDDDQEKLGTRIHDLPVLGSVKHLTDIVERHLVDDVVVAISAGVNGVTFQSIIDCHEKGVNIVPMPLIFEQLTGRIAVEHIGSQWYVALPISTGGKRLTYRIIKRLVDIIFGLLLCMIFLVLLVPVALAIRLNSRGPVFYMQERVGLHGKPYKVIKFRTMVVDAEKDGEAKWATRNDSRITTVGKFLRKTRLDELPQALNVIFGDMSMVGPRPERGAFVDKLQTLIPFYRTRLAAKPGLTGWAQVSYGYGETVEDALIKLQYDLYYLKHQSPWFDVAIILKTIGVVLRMKGQ